MNALAAFALLALCAQQGLARPAEEGGVDLAQADPATTLTVFDEADEGGNPSCPNCGMGSAARKLAAIDVSAALKTALTGGNADGVATSLATVLLNPKALETDVASVAQAVATAYGGYAENRDTSKADKVGQAVQTVLKQAFAQKNYTIIRWWQYYWFDTWNRWFCCWWFWYKPYIYYFVQYW